MIESRTNSHPEIASGSDTVRVSSEAGDSHALRSYTKAKLDLASQLRTLRETVKKRGNESRLKQCEELMAKLADDRFTLAVLGQFKRGKSSLMNAIVGRDLLPVGALPLTSAITILRYGPEVRLLVRREDVKNSIPEEFPISHLEDFVTEKKNPGNLKHLKSACIETPSAFLRRGLEFVDTPGIGSAIESNTITTLNFLPQCDAGLFVTSAECPLTDTELSFLDQIRQYVRKIFFVVNKMDLVPAEKRQEVLDYIARTIRSRLETDEVKIFPVSSKLGLTAKIADDWSEILASGLVDLESALARFLSSEKESLFLSTILTRALWLLEQESIETKLHLRVYEAPKAIPQEQLEAAFKQHRVERQKHFERLRQQTLTQIPIILLPELRSYIRSEADIFAKTADAILKRSGWWPLWDIWEKVEQAALDESSSNILDWLSAHQNWFRFVSDQIVQSDWKDIQTNINELPAVVARLLGVSLDDKAACATLSPWSLEVKFEKPFIFNFQCRAQLHVWPAILPTWLVRKWWRKHLSMETRLLAEKWQQAVIVYVAENVLKSLNLRADELESQASAAEAKLIASFQNGKLPVAENSAFLKTLDALRQKLTALYDRLFSGQTQAEPCSERCLPLPLRSIFAEIPVNEMHEINYSEALKAKNCPVCDYLVQFTFHILANFQSALIDNEGTRKDFAAKFGFCPFHNWQLESISSPLGASLGFSTVAESISRFFAEEKIDLVSLKHRKFFRDCSDCDVCRLLGLVEKNYLQGLARFVETPNGIASYSASPGLCLPHLWKWLSFLKGADLTKSVLNTTGHAFGQMAEDMQSFSLKTEALRRDLRNSNEIEACQMAISHLSGAKRNCIPMSKEAEI